MLQDVTLQERGAAGYADHATGAFAVSSFIQPLLNSWNDNSLILLERICWWLHIAGILAFLNYLPFSKHLHILLAFPNAYYARLEEQGKMKICRPSRTKCCMPCSRNSLLQAGEAPSFGAKDVMELSWRNLLDAYSCTECGRCSAVCPANITGKLLSPERL